MREELPYLWWSTRVTESENERLAEYIAYANANRGANTRRVSKGRVIREAVAIFLDSLATNRVASSGKKDG